MRVFCVAADVAPGFVVRFICVEVLPSARRHGVEDADIDHALRHATVVEEVDEDPVRYLLIGSDRSGNLLELIVLDRPQGPAGHPRHVFASQVSPAAAARRTTMTKDHGHKEDGTAITDEMVEAMADEAEAGYDVDQIIRRRGGRPAMGAAPASVESVRLDPELKRELILRSAEEHISVSESIRRAVRQYLHAS